MDGASTREGAAGVGETIVVRATRVGLGLALTAAAGVSALVGAPDREGEGGSPTGAHPSTIASLLVAAAIGAALELERRATAAAGSAQSTVRAAANIVYLTPLHRWVTEARATIDAWSERGRAEGEAGVERVAKVWDSLLSDIVVQVLAHVDVDELVSEVDVDAIAARIDIGRLIDRVDIDRIAERIDVEAIVGRLDLAAIAREVLDEIAVEDIIRESSGSLTVQTVDALRARGADADHRLAGLVDRLLGRHAERDLWIDDGQPSGGRRTGAERV